MKCTGKECLKRAARTFVQSALGYAAVNLVTVVQTNATGGEALSTALRGLIVSAIAAGLAAIMNLPKRDADVGGEADE